MNHIDAKGKACPMPVMMAKKEMDTGCEALSITVDNAIAVQNLSRLAESQGFAAETAEENGCYTITMHRTGAPAQEMPEELLNCAVPAASDYVVFAGRDVIGEGDPELGHSLIKMFFYTLSEKPDLPSAICFMNNGVRLVTENEQTIEHLKVLEAKGVKLIVCGTCLNFYGLTDKLQCGTIGNMYDIVETMTKAGKVITVQAKRNSSSPGRKVGGVLLGAGRRKTAAGRPGCAGASGLRPLRSPFGRSGLRPKPVPSRGRRCHILQECEHFTPFAPECGMTS